MNEFNETTAALVYFGAPVFAVVAAWLGSLCWSALAEFIEEYKKHNDEDSL